MGLLGKLTGADAAKKAAAQTLAAAREQNATLLALARPGINASNAGFTGLQNYVQGYLSNNLDQDSSILKAQHEESLSGIQKNTRSSTASAERFFRATGNEALGRGEKFRIGLAADEATRSENMSYATNQTNYRNEAANRYYAGVNSLINGGQTGLSLAQNGANVLAQGQQQAAQLNMQASMLNSGFMNNIIGTWLTSQKGPFYTPITTGK
jgi:hypothetical protein